MIALIFIAQDHEVLWALNSPVADIICYLINYSIRAVRRSLNPNHWSSAVVCENQSRASSATQQNNYSQSDVGTDSAYYLMFEKMKSSTEKKIENCPELPSGLGKKLSCPMKAPL
uniref:Uncharacterized protein n=1 Tax=Heliothis virescens TaxID=7102 RepID=A0A2A4JC65_HELVI